MAFCRETYNQDIHLSANSNFVHNLFPIFPLTAISTATYCPILRQNFKTSNFEEMLKHLRNKIT